MSMNAIEAMIYCLGYVESVPSDGERQSQMVFDANGEPHWFAWSESASDVHGKSPRLCSESPTPFAECLEPYRM